MNRLLLVSENAKSVLSKGENGEQLTNALANPLQVQHAAIRPWRPEFQQEFGNHLSAWIVAYYADVSNAGKQNTLLEKRRDLQLFLDFYSEIVGTDLVEYWTRSTTLRFI